VKPRDVAVATIIYDAAAAQITVYDPLDGNEYLVQGCPEDCPYGSVSNIAVSAGPCFFLGSTGSVFEIPGSNGGVVPIGPPQDIISYTCGGVFNN
jgi:hypothetical protein